MWVLTPSLCRLAAAAITLISIIRTRQSGPPPVSRKQRFFCHAIAWLLKGTRALLSDTVTKPHNKVVYHLLNCSSILTPNCFQSCHCIKQAGSKMGHCLGPLQSDTCYVLCVPIPINLMPQEKKEILCKLQGFLPHRRECGPNLSRKNTSWQTVKLCYLVFTTI